jgi:hypothetical protein
MCRIENFFSCAALIYNKQTKFTTRFSLKPLFKIVLSSTNMLDLAKIPSPKGQVDLLETVGKGNFGFVYRVLSC